MALLRSIPARKTYTTIPGAYYRIPELGIMVGIGFTAVQLKCLPLGGALDNTLCFSDTLGETPYQYGIQNGAISNSQFLLFRQDVFIGVDALGAIPPETPKCRYFSNFDFFVERDLGGLDLFNRPDRERITVADVPTQYGNILNIDDWNIEWVNLTPELVTIKETKTYDGWPPPAKFGRLELEFPDVATVEELFNLGGTGKKSIKFGLRINNQDVIVRAKDIPETMNVINAPAHLLIDEGRAGVGIQLAKPEYWPQSCVPSENISELPPSSLPDGTTDTPTTETPLGTVRLTANIKVIIEPSQTSTVRAKVRVVIDPAATQAQKIELKYPFKVNVLPIKINISDPLIQSAYRFLQDAIQQYIDEERELKTLVNYGEDRQSVALAWRYGPDTNSVQLKLLQPVPQDVSVNTPVFLSREVVQSIIEKIRVRFAPQIDATPYLRPKNTYVETDLELGKSLKDVTLKLLQLQTGSVGGTDEYKNISFEDQIFRKWYSYDFNSAELNIDFTDYNNFVFYGSAAMRLAAFKEKLKLIQKIDSKRLQFITGSITGSTNLVGRIYLQEESAKLSKQKEDIIRGFDRYEQFLYFTPSGSDKPYSASAYYADGGYEFNSSSYWPKNSSGSLYATYSTEVEDWYTSQSLIAQRFDDFNENNLVNTIPTYLREDENSAAYITFVTMVGHFFDLIKPYVDQMPYIYDRSIDPDIGLSKDLVNEIAEAFGFKLPTINSIYDLSNTILGTEDQKPRRDYTVETYKRLLHNLPFFAKAKGTRTALSSLLTTFGISQQLINVKESGAPTSSYYVFDEFSTGLDFDSTTPNSILLPILASNRNPRSLQLNLTVAKQQDTTVLNGDDKWALHARVHPTISTLGKFEITSGSSQTVILSSSYQEIFGDELLNVAIRTYTDGTASLFVGQTHNEDIIFTSSMASASSTFVSLWNSTNYIYLGGSGSLVVNNFDGTLDEVRLWGTNLSDEMTLNTVFDPGSNAGDTYEDPVDHLYVQLSFNLIETGSFPIILNETPYKNLTTIFPSLSYIGSLNTSKNDLSRYSRTVKQLVPESGPAGYLTSKVKVVAPPQFNFDSIDKNGLKRLSRTKSIVRPEQKKFQVGRNKVIVSMSPTQIINQNIVRNLGLENINAVLGAPTDLYTNFEKTLNSLKSYYQQYYYVDVNFNRYIRLVSEVNSILNQILGYFIPSKATVLKGVVIEPNILERIKIKPVRDLRFYGGNSRRTKAARGSITGSKPDYAATFNLTQTIKTITDSTVLGSNSTISTRHEDWYRTSQISQSLKPSRPVTISLQSETVRSNYETYGIQHEDWYRAQFVSQSIKPKRLVSINLQQSTLLSSYNTYGVQHEDWYRSAQVSQSIKPEKPSAIQNISYLMLGSYRTYETQHEQWYRNKLISSGSVKKRPATIEQRQSFVLGSYETYGIQHENWWITSLISQSLKLERPATISNEREKTVGSYVTYNVRHEDWYRTAQISQSLKPTRPSAINTNIIQTNKVPYNDVNKGSPGAEPFNRIYTRKLFDVEISKIVPNSGRVLYTPALYEIKPSTDFTDVGVTTYFNKEDGIYAFSEIVKTPSYREPINFESATTWSYGQRYNVYDVVYQAVDKSYTELGDLTGSAKAGNGRYYVFTTRPAYVTSSNNTAVYLGSTPSYIPPSLDKTNWDLLRFTPVEVRAPRRIVFDTFTISNPELNNYKVTTLNVDRVVDIPDRYVDLVEIPAILANSYVVGNIALQNIAALFALQFNQSGVRIRFYRTELQRNADVSRPNTVKPEGSSGVLLDVSIQSSRVVKLIDPIVSLVAGSTPPEGIIYYTIDNLTSSEQLFNTLTLFYFAIQIEPRIPKGYLRKHYRFFRDNSTGTKRRNYLGCKNTVDTTIDGLPPIQVFLSEGTDVTVSQTLTNTEIRTGGGGTLNVT